MGSSKFFRKVLPIAATALGYAVGGPAGAAVASGATNYTQNHNIGQAALSAGGSYIGSNIGSSLLGGTGGTIGNALNDGLGETVGSSVLPSLGGNILGSNLGSAAGSFLGGSIGSDLASSLVPQKSKNPTGESASNVFKPSRSNMAAPLSIQGLGQLTPEQQTSNIATGGVYGGGQGPDEQKYFLNLINQRLVDESGNVDQDFRDIGGIENSYLAQLGLGNKKNPTDLLQAISSWRA